MSRLPLSFYQRDTKMVARELLGKKLVRIYKGKRLSGIITEVEAYLGVHDKACHTFAGKRTARTESMYLAGGHTYVYLIYGIYNCLNVVSSVANCPEAVLIRAIEPIDGIETMKSLRRTENQKNLTTGPGKLTEALHIDRTMSDLNLKTSKELFIEKGILVKPSQIAKSPRIGVDYAGEHAELLLRFYLKNSVYVSKTQARSNK